MDTLQQPESQGRPTASFILDTPNHYRRVKAAHGPNAEPDWGGLLTEARLSATVTDAIAVVNNGVSPDVWNRLEDAGYTIAQSHAPDCDELVIAQIVRTSRKADVVVIGSGDGKYADVAVLLRQVGKRVIVLAVSGSVHKDLLAAVDQFVEMPVVFRRRREEEACAA